MLYKVRKGDTLWSLARQFGTTVDEIARCNGIFDPNILNVDQILRIPINTNMDNNENNNSVVPVFHIVQKGDTLWQIAKKHNVTVADLINLNKLTNPDLIYPEQVLIVKNP